MLRLLSLRLYRAPYYNLMRPWEKRLHDAGLLGYLVKDVIGAQQEESFGIRQNHTMYLADWERLIRKHFVALEYDTFVPDRGWAESVVRKSDTDAKAAGASVGRNIWRRSARRAGR